MNAEFLKEFIDNILLNEGHYAIQKHYSTLSTNLNDLTSAPQEQNHQIEVARSLDLLWSTVSEFETEFSYKDRERFIEIKAEDYFSLTFVDAIRKYIAENPLSPAVARDHVNAHLSTRNQYIQTLTNLTSGLESIGVMVKDLDADEAEIGFQIPREIFNNNIEGLIKELRAIRLIVRTFSEVTTGNVDEINIGQISTSDPLIFIAQSTPVIIALSVAVKWALQQWKTVKEIRKLRAETTQLKEFTEKEISEFFDSKITTVIEKAITKHVTELIKKSPLDAPRKKEMRKGLTDALNSLFARIERGMTIELRLLPLKRVAFYVIQDSQIS